MIYNFFFFLNRAEFCPSDYYILIKRLHVNKSHPAYLKRTIKRWPCIRRALGNCQCKSGSEVRPLVIWRRRLCSTGRWRSFATYVPIQCNNCSYVEQKTLYLPTIDRQFKFITIFYFIKSRYLHLNKYIYIW